MKLRVIARLVEIQRVLVRHGLDEFVRATHLYRPLRFVFLLSPWTWAVRRRDEPRAVRLREDLDRLDARTRLMEQLETDASQDRR